MTEETSKKRFLIEVINIEDKQNTHTMLRTNTLFSKYTWEDEEGTSHETIIEPKDLYEVQHGFLKGIWNWATTGQRFHYLLIIRSDGSTIEETSPEISGKVLKVARDWKGLDGAIEDSFGSNFELGRLGVVAIAGVAVIILVVLVWQGWIPLPRSWGI